MTLDEWRLSRGWTFTDLGRALNLSPEAARRYCKLGRVPRPLILQSVVKLTGGAVQAADFYPTPSDTISDPTDLL